MQEMTTQAMGEPTGGRFVLDLGELDRADVERAGGKAANLGELMRIEEVEVPDGFCVTTDAFELAVLGDPSVRELLDELAALDGGDPVALQRVGSALRRSVEAVVLPGDLDSDIADAVDRLAGDGRWAVRSSATAEDSSGASFAGQHDTHLNVVSAEVSSFVVRCWASLFTDRSIDYRIRRGIEHRRVRMAVVVQRMVDPAAAGVLFTADPVTSNRRVCVIEATYGLGDALVGGSVDADTYVVRDGRVGATIAAKATALEPAAGGGVAQVPVTADRSDRPVLTTAQALELAAAGRRIEAHFGAPQDIEWCLVGGRFCFVQSRPITTLFPIPDAADGGNRVYVSVGHQQMMTDPMKPLGLSFWQMTAQVPMAVAGGRLFVDVTARLGAPSTRDAVLGALGRSDPLIGDALRTVLERGDFIATVSDDQVQPGPLAGGPPTQRDTDPAIVETLIDGWTASTDDLRRRIRAVSDSDLFELIEADIVVLRELLFDPTSLQVIMAAIDASWWLNEHIAEWLGEPNVADTLTLSAPNNVTSEMGLELLDVADVLREHPAVVERLRSSTGGDDTELLDDLPGLAGGATARAAIESFLDRYGMRCVGEIDITRPRWSEQPGALVPLLLGHIKNHEPGEARRRLEAGRRAAESKEREVLDRLRTLSDGQAKATETKAKIDVLRTFIGYREYPKYAWMARYEEYRRSLMREAATLVAAGVIDDPDDIGFLTFAELRDAVATGRVDRDLIAVRASEFRSYEVLRPPRVLTSDGEALGGSYHRSDIPPGALPGLAVSAGVVEGRARVVLDMAEADLDPGDILVTTHTDPSWTPVFVTAAGLVTEVGGLMTHGAVVAREYGLPAVVGVLDATDRIRDGQWIRIDGTRGYVELEMREPDTR